MFEVEIAVVGERLLCSCLHIKVSLVGSNFLIVLAAALGIKNNDDVTTAVLRPSL